MHSSHSLTKISIVYYFKSILWVIVLKRKYVHIDTSFFQKYMCVPISVFFQDIVALLLTVTFAYIVLTTPVNIIRFIWLSGKVRHLSTLTFI